MNFNLPKLTGLFFCVCLSFQSAAQKETSNWYFRDRQGISFNTMTPQQIAGIPTSNLYNDNTTVCSDANGNMKFICRSGFPAVIYDRNYNPMAGPMPNGSAWACRTLWARYPGDPDKYFLFYAIAGTDPSICELKYAIIDMSLNSGLGQVTVADVVVDANLSVGFCLINRAGTDEFWIINNSYRTKNFFARLVTTTGVSAAKVTSVAGSNDVASEYNFTSMKGSPNGKMFAGGTYTRYLALPFFYDCQFIEVFNINNQTGVITNKVKSVRNVYGLTTDTHLEFSPDNRLLYSMDIGVAPGLQPCGFSSSTLRQYNLCYSDSTTFSRYVSITATIFNFCSYPVWGNIQVAPDKQIYMKYTGNTMSTIRSPNRIGTSANYLFNAFTTVSSTGVYLPAFYQHEMEKPIKNNIVYAGSCHPNPLSFSVTNDTLGGINWNFGDPASGPQNVSVLMNPSHVFSAPGNYTVTAALLSSSGMPVETISEVIEVKDPAIRLLHDYPTDTSFCGTGNLKLKLSVHNGIFEWSVRALSGAITPLNISDSFSITSPGTYLVHMKQNDCDGCELYDSITVNMLPVPNVYLGQDKVICGNQDSVKIGVYDNMNNIASTWSTGQVTDSIWVTSPGQYWVQCELSGNGCLVSDTINVSLNPAVSFSLPEDTTLCTNQSLLLDATVPGAQYLWQDNSTGPTFNVTTPGTYWVKVTSNSCSKTDSIIVGMVNASTVYLGSDTSLCTGDTLYLQSNLSNAQYQWSTGENTQVIRVTSPGQYWVKVQVGGCWASDTINIQFNSIPTFSFGLDTVLCEDKNLLLNAPVAGTYLWQDNSTGNSFQVNQAGLYWLQVKQLGCIFRDSINVSYKPAPNFSLGNDTTICTGTVLQLIVNAPAIVAWHWQDGSSNNSYPAINDGFYHVEVTAANGCTKSDSIYVDFITLPALNLGNDTAICSTGSLNIQTGINGVSHLWSDGSTGNSISVNTAGDHWVEIGQQGCTKRDSINVSIKNSPVINLGADTVLCNLETLLLNATNTNSSYLWQDGSSLGQFFVTMPGTYSVLVDKVGCIGSDTIIVGYKSKPVFSLGADQEICPTNLLILNPGNFDADYLWQDGSTAPVYQAQQPGLYSLQLSNDCGSSADTLSLTAGLCDLYVPGAFTPNDDKVNDLFKVKLDKQTSFFNLKVFNRYGQIVFESSDKNKGWDGKYKGSVLPVGTYVWVLKYSIVNYNVMNETNGTVVLLQ